MNLTSVVDEILVCVAASVNSFLVCSSCLQTHIQNTNFNVAPVSDDNLSMFESTVCHLKSLAILDLD